MWQRDILELYSLPPGKRLIVSGSTGSGKSTLSLEYLARSTYHWIVFNPKRSKLYQAGLKKAGITVGSLTSITKATLVRSFFRNRVTVLDFGVDWDWKAQDQLLLWLCEKYENFGICVDELYKIHNNGRAGPGLDGLLTRGRELGQTFIGCTQRPVYVSKFVYSEADVIVEFHLLLEDDRKVIYKNTGQRAAMLDHRDHDFLYFDVAARAGILYRARGTA